MKMKKTILSCIVCLSFLTPLLAVGYDAGIVAPAQSTNTTSRFYVPSSNTHVWLTFPITNRTSDSTATSSMPATNITATASTNITQLVPDYSPSKTTPERFVGPRGGVYHYSANGNKVYEKRK